MHLADSFGLFAVTKHPDWQTCPMRQNLLDLLPPQTKRLVKWLRQHHNTNGGTNGTSLPLGSDGKPCRKPSSYFAWMA
jgi:hypothetical protein